MEQCLEHPIEQNEILKYQEDYIGLSEKIGNSKWFLSQHMKG